MVDETASNDVQSSSEGDNGIDLTSSLEAPNPISPVTMPYDKGLIDAILQEPLSGADNNGQHGTGSGADSGDRTGHVLVSDDNGGSDAAAGAAEAGDTGAGSGEQVARTDAQSDDEHEPPVGGDGAEGAASTVFQTDSEEALTVPDSATTTVLVDGKEEKFTIAELKRDVQGRIPWNEHFRELKEERARFDAERSQWDNMKANEQTMLKTLFEKLQDDPWTAIVDLAIESGQNPASFLPKYFEQAIATAKDTEGLSDEQIQAVIHSKDVQYREKLLENKEEAVRKTTEATKADEEFVRHIERAKSANKIEDGELRSAFENLWKLHEDPSVDFSFEDKSDKERVDATVKYIVNDLRPYQRLGKILYDINPELLQDDELVLDLKKMALDGNPGISDNDIKTIVLEVTGKSQAPSEPQTEATVQTEASTASSTENSTPGTTSQKIPQKEEGRAEDDDNYNPMDMDDILRRHRL